LARVGDACSVAVGFAFRSQEFSSTGIRLLRGENIEPGSLRWKDTRYWPEEKVAPFENLIIEEGDIILAMDRPVISSGLKLARATSNDVPCLLVQRVARIRSSVRHLNAYLYYNLQSRGFIDHLIRGQTGTQLPHISHKAIPEYEFPLAPDGEQRRIVAKIEELFSDLDAGVAALERVRANLSRYRAAVLKAAVEGKLTEDWRAKHPDTEPASVLLERILAERRRWWEKEQLAKFASSGQSAPETWARRYAEPVAPDVAKLPQLPAGWSWATWNQVSDWVTYGFTRPMPHVGEGIPIVTAKNVAERKISLDRAHLTSLAAYMGLSDKDRPRVGDILVTKDGTIGRAAVVSEIGEFCINQSVAVVWLRSCFLPRKFLLAVIESELTQRPIMAKARGVAIQHLSITDFAKLPLPLPSVDEMIAIEEEIDRRFSIVDEIEAELEANLKRAARLRQGILKRAFEGRLVAQDPKDEPAAKLLERIGQRDLGNQVRGPAHKKSSNEPRRRTEKTIQRNLFPEGISLETRDDGRHQTDTEHSLETTVAKHPGGGSLDGE
jgi:type I restriction enzyme S subunit